MSTGKTPEVRGYELVHRLGAGDGSTRWSGRRRASGEAVTLDVVDPEIGLLAGFAARLQAVAHQVGALRHPRILGVLDVVAADGVVAVVEEPARAAPLSSLIEGGAPLPPATAVAIVDDVLRAIGVAHGAGIVHCGVTPSRVLVDERGELRLGGFALARAMALTGGETGRPRPGYASPERLGGALPDGLGDLYAAAALGCVLLTGRTPAPGAAPPVPALPGMSTVLQQAVAADPGRRQPSAAALRAAITAVAAAELGDAWRAQADSGERARAAIRLATAPTGAPAVPAPGAAAAAVDPGGSDRPASPEPPPPGPASMAWRPLESDADDEPGQGPRRNRRTALILVVALLAGAAAALAIVLVARSNGPGASTPLSVGSDVHLTYTKQAGANCRNLFTFVATGSLSGSGTLSYRFVPDDPGIAQPQTVTQQIDGNPGFRFTYPILYQGHRTGSSKITFEILAPTRRSVSTTADTSCQ